MKVLFVGEGPHEIGHADTHPNEPRPAGGVLCALASRASAGISEDSIAIQWRDIVRFNPDAKRGLDRRVAAAVVLGSRRFGCGGTICVHDRDGDTDRLPAMLAGRQWGLNMVDSPHHIVCAVAVESIEAWTLGAPTALAAHLKVDNSRIFEEYNPKVVETFKESSEKKAKQPKTLLQRVAKAIGHQDDSTEFRVCVAGRSSVEELKVHCKIGFLPFADALTAAFGGSPEEAKEDDD